MSITRGTGIQQPTTTTRTTGTLLFPCSIVTTKEYVSIEEIFDAYYSCRKHKRNTQSALKFEMDYILECYKLWKELNEQTYTIGTSVAFCVTYPKLREVFAADFRDRIIHHLIINKFNTLFEEEMIDDAYACRKNKGSLYGIKGVQQHMKDVEKDAWYAKCDIQGFFMSIDRKILYEEIESIILINKVDNWEWWLWLIKMVVMNSPDKNCRLKGNTQLWNKLPKNKSLFHTNGKGLPIGNLTSQVFANIYMSIFDRWITKKLGKEGRYGRYVDDFIIIHPSRKKVIKLVKESKIWLNRRLGIRLHPKKLTIQQVCKGIRFTGIFIKGDCLYPSKRLVENTYYYINNQNGKDKKKFRDKINSRFGLMIYFNSYKLRRRLWRIIKEYKGLIFINCKKLKVI